MDLKKGSVRNDDPGEAGRIITKQAIDPSRPGSTQGSTMVSATTRLYNKPTPPCQSEVRPGRNLVRHLFQVRFVLQNLMKNVINIKKRKLRNSFFLLSLFSFLLSTAHFSFPSKVLHPTQNLPSKKYCYYCDMTTIIGPVTTFIGPIVDTYV